MKTAFKIVALVLLVGLIIGGIPVAGLMILCGIGANNQEMTGGGSIVLLFVGGCVIGAINLIRSLARKPPDEHPEELP